MTSPPPFPENTEEVPGTDVPTWAPLDLAPYLDGSYEPIVPSLFTRSDGVSLIYPGQTHSFHGESESCKSMMAQSEAQRVLASGGRVLYVDFESDAAAVAERLLLLGTPARVIRDHSRFAYVKPEVAPETAAEATAWLGLLRQRFDLAVIDGVTDSLTMFGYSTIDNDQLTAWAKRLPRKIAEQTGAAVIQVDHVTKDSDSRGRFALGGQAKMNGLTGAAYTVEVAETVGRGLRGVVVMRVAKDRHGYVRAHSGKRRPDGTQETARIVVDSTGDGGIQVSVESWKGADGVQATPGTFRPTHLMQQASELLEAAPAALSFRTIDDLMREQNMKGKREFKMAALSVLVAEGYVGRVNGPRNANMHRSIKPYREATDPLSDQYEPGNTRPALTTVSVPRLRDGDGGTHTQPLSGTVGERSGNGDTCTKCSRSLTTSVQLTEGLCRLHLSGQAREGDAVERGRLKMAVGE
jgi:hypothetical protein